MYIPKEFKVSDRKSIKTFISKYNFGMLIMNGMDGMPLVSHLPFVFKEKDNEIILEFHLAKANHQARIIKNGAQGKVVVNGPNAYVSSSVYGHVNVPTYNYQTVHLMGSLEVLSKEELITHSKELVALFESKREKQVDTSVWPIEMMEAYTNEIIGIRLNVFKVEAAFKLSQNRNEEDYQAIIQDLLKGNCNEQTLAEEMKKWRK